MVSIINQNIDTIISLGIAKTLKQEGFKKKAHNFYLREPDFIRILNIQSDRWNIGSTGQFTINLSVYFPTVQNLVNPLRKGVLPKEGHALQYFRRRIGALLPPLFRDKWWQVDEQSDLEAIAQEVSEAYLQFGKPWLFSYSSLQEIQLILNNDIARDYDSCRMIIVLNIALGNLPQALLWLEKTHDKFPWFKEELNLWVETLPGYPWTMSKQ